MDRQLSRTGKAPVRRGLAFWVSERASAPRGPWSGIGLSLSLSFGFLALCIWWTLRELAAVVPNDRVTLALSAQEALGSVLARQLLQFGAALVTCHAFLGFAAFALARLTEAAHPHARVARRGALVFGWFGVLVALVGAANATWHPASIFASEESWLLRDLAGYPPVMLALAAFAVLVAYLAVRAAPRLRTARPSYALAGVCTLVVAIGVAAILPRAGAAGSGPASSQPHIVIIGVDSLRNDLAGAAGARPLTPHIDRFLSGSQRFDDAISPLARTYASWVTILTGRHPVTTNARVNLMPRRLVRQGETLADALRAHGYRTFYATDEVRFANIDASFGFDRVETPPIGAIDFLLGHLGDQPLVNLTASTPAGFRLFPSNHANRAAHVTYRPADFVARLERTLEIRGPTLVAVHLTLSHWPYSWAGIAAPGNPQQYRPAYRRSIEAVDRQFDQVMQVLGAKGVLDNAIVVLLSDHGEALGGATDSMLRDTGSGKEIWNSLWGHGTSVLSPNQYQVLLAMRPFGRATLAGKPARHKWPVSLEDVRPTLEEIATGSAPTGVDGVSLLPYLADPAGARTLVQRVRFTETDFNTPSTLAGRYEASGIVDEASVFYEIDTRSGWVQFRPERLPGLLADKQRAAIGQDTLLAAIPGASGRSVRYLYTDRRNPRPRALETPPDPLKEPEARRLWEALQARFSGELPPPANLPRL
jgi:hypothetical protein